jgi:thiol-disulfide isomerase/thioredoxin
VPIRRRTRRCAAVLLVVTAVLLVPPGNEGSGASRATVDLTAARTGAGLRPCPPPSGGGPGVLRGVRASCLGDGTSVDLGSALAGQTTLINLWASWCEVCRTELRVLEAYAASPEAVRVLGVQILSPPADGLALLTSLGVHLPSVVDDDGGVARALHAPPYVPVSYLVASDGTVRQVLPPTPFTSTEQVARAARTSA